jgi:hypothetical protein
MQLVLEVPCSNLGEVIGYLRIFLVFKGPEEITIDHMVPVY